LRGIELRKAETGPVQGLSAATVDAFKKTANEIRTKATQQDSTAEKEPEEIAQSKLEPLEHQDLVDLSLQADAMRLSNLMMREQIEESTQILERMKQIEERLPPLRLSDLLLRDFVEQLISISEEYTLLFRTVDAEIELDLDLVCREIARGFGETGQAIENQTFLLQVATLVSGLVSFSGQEMHARAIHAEKDVKARRDLIRQTTLQFLRKPGVMLQDLFRHQAAFTARVRKVFNTTGYVRQQVGKS